ncbi:MAG: valine--tRNA ligase [Candidatus Helarchaeota archaeon]
MTDLSSNKKIEIDKNYNFSEVEEKWLKIWDNLEDQRRASAEVKEKKTFVISMPPPNVTGKLTMGHGLVNLLQDILIRLHKLKGYNVLWIPGFDHASIATEIKVEEYLRKQNIYKKDLGREKFLEYCVEWSENKKEIITKQLKRQGYYLDWTRSRYTMDKEYYYAVIECFIRLYKKGLIFKDKRLINWCPASLTALSDEEVDMKEEEGSLYYIKYPLVNENDYIIVATTRPETLLGDTAVAINPDDEKNKKYIGKYAIIPFVNRKVKIIGDSRVKTDFGTGIVKVTPAHDPADFEIGKEHGLEFINIFNENATINENGAQFKGQDRFEARKNIIKQLKDMGLFVKEEKCVHNVPYSQRANVIIEYILSQQWFLKMDPFVENAINAVKNGEIRFYPQRWENSYYNWLYNIKDWCISRQLWWGHRIPVYYCEKCGHQNVGHQMPKICEKCGNNKFKQDPDVLDTWFSSWLWPFAILGWPKETMDLKTFFPTSVLVSAPDIIFFWIARMIFASQEFLGKNPFSVVIFNGLLRDKLGRKMSKSLGNSPEPLKLIDKYGADAVRLSYVLPNPIDRDIIFDESTIVKSKQFLRKLWNVFRLLMLLTAEMDKIDLNKIDPNLFNTFDKWILSRFNRTVKKVNAHFENYNFNGSIVEIHHFIWHSFCDWYVEIVKIYNKYADKKIKENMKLLGIKILLDSLKLLHPFAPFITEEIWSKFTFNNNYIIDSDWPKADESLISDELEDNFKIYQNIITSIRKLRLESNFPKKEEVEVYLIIKEKVETILTDEMKNLMLKICNIGKLDLLKEKDEKLAKFPAITGENFISIINTSKNIELEKERLIRKLKKLEIKLAKNEKLLHNKNFLTKAFKDDPKAKEQKIAEIKNKVDTLKDEINTIQEILNHY